MKTKGRYPWVFIDMARSGNWNYYYLALETQRRWTAWEADDTANDRSWRTAHNPIEFAPLNRVEP